MSKLFKKYKRLFSSKTFKPLIVVFVLLATSALVYAATYIPSISGFKSSTGTTITVAEHSVGKNVRNTSDKNYFIPTGSLDEWNSFISAALSPSGLPGISLSGLSWSTSGFGSCSSTCSGYTQTQTVWCAGTDGATTADSYCIPGDKPLTTNTCAAVLSVCPVAGVCGGPSNTCSSGTASGYSAGSCGGSQTWSCVGLNEGATVNCSIANAVCVTYSWQPDGTYGTCSNGSYDCGPGTKPTSYQCEGSDGAWYGDASCSGDKPVASVDCTINNTVCTGSLTFTYPSYTVTLNGVTYIVHSGNGAHSFVVPNVSTSIGFELVGGGGGGGGGNGYGYGEGHGAAGGGGGQVSSGTLGATPGSILSIIVGAGGAGGDAGGNNAYGTKGKAGGDSKILANVGGWSYDVSRATGGGGGGRAEYGGTAPADGGIAGGSGGTAGEGGSRYESEESVCVGTRRNCSDYRPTYTYYYGASGRGGSSGLFLGGAALPRVKHIGDTSPTSADYGNNGTNFGAGGGGATSDHFGGGGGGFGYPGYVKITW